MKNLGLQLEKDIVDLARIYERQGVLVLEKTDPPVVYMGKFVVKRNNNPFVDFVGVWTQGGGRAIFMEAKYTKDEYLRIGGAHGSGGVDDRQVESLMRWRSAGAVSFLLWNCPEGTVVVDAGWVAVGPELFGRKYASFSEVHEKLHGIRLNGLLFEPAMAALVARKCNVNVT